MSDAASSENRREPERERAARLNLKPEYAPDDERQARALLLMLGFPADEIEQELGCDIQAIREPVPSQIAPGARALIRAMYAGVSQCDREELLAAMRAGKIRAAKEGRWAGGSVPFGLRLEICRVPGRAKPVKRLVPAEETAGIVREIFTLYAAGNSQKEIARLLNARGVTHPTGEQWRQSTISYMLRNPFYKGEGVWRRRYEAKNTRGGQSKYNSPAENVVPYEDYQIPAIVPPELWERCAHLRHENMKLAPRNARHLYLLRAAGALRRVQPRLHGRQQSAAVVLLPVQLARGRPRSELRQPARARRRVGAVSLGRDRSLCSESRQGLRETTSGARSACRRGRCDATHRTATRRQGARAGAGHHMGARGVDHGRGVRHPTRAVAR